MRNGIRHGAEYIPKKGIVEAGDKYLKINFLPLREFRNLVDLNAQACGWVMNEGGQRIHGSTRWRTN